MQPFEFHGDLFELRSRVLDALAARGFLWMRDFGSVDLSHDTYGLEVTGIPKQEQATQIHQLLQELFPKWRFHRQYYEDRNLREAGWKVVISREQEKCSGRWQQEGGDSFGPVLSRLEAVRAKLDLAERIIEATSKQLLSPDVSDGTRAELEASLEQLREMKRRAEVQRRRLEKGQTGDE